MVDAHADRLQVVGLAAGENAELLAAQVARYRPRIAAMASGAALDRLKASGAADGLILGAGREGLVAVASHPDVDLVLCASSGTEGLDAVLAAIEHGKTIALANKEILVMAGRLVTEAATRAGVAILPVDSEHNAIHQCLHGRNQSEIKKLILTASGGPFRGRSLSSLASVTPAEALNHPTWRMGRKITIDSATLMNKGLEVIEARWLFGVRADQIEVVVHPQSVVHSMVELTDGSVIAQLGAPDMRTPIACALAWPERIESGVEPLDFATLGRFDFERVDPVRFPCVRLAGEAIRRGGTAPAALNAANEVAVQSFLDGRLAFTGIAEVIENVLEETAVEALMSLDHVYVADLEARALARRLIARRARHEAPSTR